MNSLLVQYNGNVRDALAAYNAGSANIAAGYGYADNILAAAGVRRTITDTNPGPQYGGSRPGGGPAGPPTPTPGSSVDDVLNNYVALRDMPRTAPPGTKNPFSWWKASFTGDWDTFRGGGGTDNG